MSIRDNLRRGYLTTQSGLDFELQFGLEICRMLQIL